MQAEIELQQSDYLMWYRYEDYRSDQYLFYRQFRWAFLGMGAFFIFIAFFRPTGAFSVNILGALFFFILGMLYPEILNWWYQRRHERYIREMNHAHLGKSFHFNLQHNHIETNFEGGVREVPYSDIFRVVDIESHYFVFLRPDHPVIIPQSELIDPFQFREIMLSRGVNVINHRVWRHQ